MSPTLCTILGNAGCRIDGLADFRSAYPMDVRHAACANPAASKPRLRLDKINYHLLSLERLTPVSMPPEGRY